MTHHAFDRGAYTMLTLSTTGGGRNCNGFSRRDFLRVGSLSLGGLTLAELLAARAVAQSNNADFIKDRSVVLLYLSGGASHIETFDPRMDAPNGIRSATGEVKTKIPGVTFGGTFPQMASLARQMTIVRSFAHSVGSHQQAHVHVLSGGTDPRGRQEQGFSIGSAHTRLRGTHHPDSGLPTFALLTEKEIDGQYRKEISRVRAGSWPGALGPAYAPFEHQIGWEGASTKPEKKKKPRPPTNPLIANMRLNLSSEDFQSRLKLLKKLDHLKREADTSGRMEAMDRYMGQAAEMVLGNASKVFSYQDEDPKLIQRYDTSHIKIGHKKFRPSTLGKQLLMARRFCERGCGFVTIHSAGWDMHADGNNPGIVKGMEMLGRSLDKAVSAFIEDVQQRGLSEKILLVITGDFGRTPKINKKGGRDHWARLATLAFAGGPKTGQVIGRSAQKVDVPATDPISPRDLLTTVFHYLFDIGKLRLASGIPGPVTQAIANGNPIDELL